MQFTKIIPHIISTHQNNKDEQKPPTIPPTTSQSSKSTANFPTNSYLSNWKLKYHSKQPNKPQTPSCQTTKKTIKQLGTKKTLKQPDKTFQQKKNYLRQHKQAQTQKKKTKLFFPINSPPPSSRRLL